MPSGPLLQLFAFVEEGDGLGAVPAERGEEREPVPAANGRSRSRCYTVIG